MVVVVGGLVVVVLGGLVVVVVGFVVVADVAVCGATVVGVVVDEEDPDVDPVVTVVAGGIDDGMANWA